MQRRAPRQSVRARPGAQSATSRQSVRHLPLSHLYGLQSSEPPGPDAVTSSSHCADGAVQLEFLQVNPFAQSEAVAQRTAHSTPFRHARWSAHEAGPVT